MEKYVYKPILSQEQIARYLWRQKWALRIFGVLFALATLGTFWNSKLDAEIISILAAVSFYLMIFFFGGFVIFLKLNPDCTPILAHQQTDLLKWRKEFEEVEVQVQVILNQRPYVTQVEFKEIKQRTEFLSSNTSTSSPEDTDKEVGVK